MTSFSQVNVPPAQGKAVLGRLVIGGRPVATRADELAAWLSARPFAALPARPADVTGHDWQSKVKGRRGILFFGAYWMEKGDPPGRPSGSHIDLWNGQRLTNNGVIGAAETFLRFSLGVDQVPLLYSDLGNAKRILFFEIH